jgi:hypothetical protein
LDNGAPAVKAAMGARTVRQHGFAAIGTRTPLRLGNGIMGAALVFDSFRSSSFGHRHGLSPVFPCFKAAAAKILANPV